MTHWDIYYRGSLSSCNYACPYCPFAKTSNSRAELRQDQAELGRFVHWACQVGEAEMSVLFTPWGEALGHRYYRAALVKLSHLPHLRRVAIQTNLSAPLGDLAAACPQTLTLWATYHPGEVTRSRFLDRCRTVEAMGLSFSVGVVGMLEHLDEIEALRAELSPDIYLWVNAYKRVENYYSDQALSQIKAVDPYFGLNSKRHPSSGAECRAGETHFTVDGAGDVRRCHFVGDVLGNLYSQEGLPTFLRSRSCPMATCGCYIGYIHQPALKLDGLYGENRLGRIPEGWPRVIPSYAAVEVEGSMATSNSRPQGSEMRNGIGGSSGNRRPHRSAAKL